MTDLRRTPLRRLLLLSALMGGASLVEDTATGNPVTFETDVAKPLVSLEIPFTPKQSGTGDPSPQNIRPILPWDGLKVFGGGKNLLECEIGATKSNNGVDYVVLPNHGINCKGETVTYSSYGIDSKKIQLKAGTYAFSVSGATNVKTVFVKNGAYWFEISGSGSSAKTITADSEVYCYFMVTSGNEVDETVFVQLEVGSTASSYEEYKPITETDISFPSPVYGGTLDVVSGVLTVTHEGLVSTWGQAKVDRKQSGYQQGRMFFTHDVPVSGQSGASATNQKCNIAKYQWDDFNGTPHFYTGTLEGRNCAVILIPEDTPDETEIVVSAKLKTTYEVQLTGEQITALVGDNTIWSDADGSMTAVYLEKG